MMYWPRSTRPRNCGRIRIATAMLEKYPMLLSLLQPLQIFHFGYDVQEDQFQIMFSYDKLPDLDPGAIIPTYQVTMTEERHKALPVTGGDDGADSPEQEANVTILKSWLSGGNIADMPLVTCVVETTAEGDLWRYTVTLPA